MNARRRAEGCFALARSTTHAPERETAIAIGISIADAAGLDLDDFNIPGRSPAARRAAASGAGEPQGHPFDWTAYQAELAERVRANPAPRFGRHASPAGQYTRENLREVTGAFQAHMRGVNSPLRDFEAALQRRARETGARDDETVYDAQRRNFDEAAARARARDEARS
jgi:hypothetical protein